MSWATRPALLALSLPNADKELPWSGSRRGTSLPHDLYQHILGKMTLPTFSVHMAFASLLILMYTTAHSHQHPLLPPNVRSSLMSLNNGTNHAEIFFRALPKASKEALLLKFISYKGTALPRSPYISLQLPICSLSFWAPLLWPSPPTAVLIEGKFEEEECSPLIQSAYPLAVSIVKGASAVDWLARSSCPQHSQIV